MFDCVCRVFGVHIVCVCVSVCMYVSAAVHVCVCVSVFMYAPVNVCTPCMYVSEYVHIIISVCVHVNMCVCLDICVRVRVCVNVQRSIQEINSFVPMSPILCCFKSNEYSLNRTSANLMAEIFHNKRQREKCFI